MRGETAGVLAKVPEVCPNLIDIDGCGVHKMNLLQKDEIKEPEIKKIIDFAESISSFIEKKPKVQSMLRQAEKYLGLNRINDYCQTRFLSLNNMLTELCHQFPLIRKIVQLSNDSRLLSYFDDPMFLIDLDQFLIHVQPIHDFTKSMQSPDLDIFTCLEKLLELLRKLMQRLGHSTLLTPQKFISVLYHKDGSPRSFQSKTKELFYDKESPHVNTAMSQMNEHEIARISQRWNTLNEKQLHRLLARFSKFLQSEIVRRCHVLKANVINDSYLRNLSKLCDAMNLNRIAASDELAVLRGNVCSETMKPLTALFKENRLSNSPTLSQLVTTTVLYVPHNMTVESGFSKMKFHENAYKTGFSEKLYDGIRLASDYFHRESLEEFEIPDELLKRLSQASRLYTDEEKRRFLEKQMRNQDATEIKRKIGIYERKNDKALAKEIQETDNEIEAMEKKLQEARSKKRRLEEDCEASKMRRDMVSSSVIDAFFRRS
jgi:hypothetical protein